MSNENVSFNIGDNQGLTQAIKEKLVKENIISSEDERISASIWTKIMNALKEDSGNTISHNNKSQQIGNLWTSLDARFKTYVGDTITIASSTWTKICGFFGAKPATKEEPGHELPSTNVKDTPVKEMTQDSAYEESDRFTKREAYPTSFKTKNNETQIRDRQYMKLISSTVDLKGKQYQKNSKMTTYFDADEKKTFSVITNRKGGAYQVDYFNKEGKLIYQEKYLNDKNGNAGWVKTAGDANITITHYKNPETGEVIGPAQIIEKVEENGQVKYKTTRFNAKGEVTKVMLDDRPPEKFFKGIAQGQAYEGSDRFKLNEHTYKDSSSSFFGDKVEVRDQNNKLYKARKVSDNSIIYYDNDEKQLRTYGPHQTITEYNEKGKVVSKIALASDGSWVPQSNTGTRFTYFPGNYKQNVPMPKCCTEAIKRDNTTIYKTTLYNEDGSINNVVETDKDIFGEEAEKYRLPADAE